MKIAITPRGFANYGLDVIEQIRKKGYKVIYNDTGKAFDKEKFYEFTSEADGLIVGVEKVDNDYIDSHPKLKAVVKFGVGIDNIDVEYANSKNIFVGRTAGSNSRSVAETAVSFIMADSKNLYSSIEDTREMKWDKLTGYEVKDKTVGILGFGSIGKEVAKIVKGLSMNVLAYDPFPIDEKYAEESGVKISAFDEVIEKSDFITLHMPLNEETRNLINLEVIHKMKPEAVLINTSRGGIINEQDLYIALSQKIIRASYSDVFSSEPPREDEPLLTLDNFYLTPHIASRSVEAEKNTVKMSADVLLKALEERK